MFSTAHFHWPLSALEHGAFVFAGLLVYVTSTRMSSQHRHPSAAVAWVLLIALLPYLGIPLYLLFGVRKVLRTRSGARGSTQAPPGMQLDWYFRLTNALDVPAATVNERVAFHSDGQAALAALLNLLDGAQRQVDLCTFILEHDALGRRVCDALKRAAARGVRVRVLLDDLGSWRLGNTLRRELRLAGVTVKRFMPLRLDMRWGRANLRNHRKMAVVDQAHVWSGGRNLAQAYFLSSPEQPAWSDLSYVVSGPCAIQAALLFEQDWHDRDQSPQPTPMLQVTESVAGKQGAWAQWVPSGPDQSDDTLYALLMAAAYRAEQRIVLISPYFVPDDALLAAWCMACRRGVEVTLVVPHRSNHRLADIARGRALRALRASGARVMLFPQMLHAKAVIIDGDLAMCGSANLDSRSLFLNYELATVFFGDTELAWLSQWARHLINLSTPMGNHKPSWSRELLEGLVRVIGFQL